MILKVKNYIKKLKSYHNYHLLLEIDNSKILKKELYNTISVSLFTLIIVLLFIIITSPNVKFIIGVTLSLFVSFSFSFLIISLLNIEIHKYTLAGYILSLGLVIDNIIIAANELQIKKNAVVPLLVSTFTTIGVLVLGLLLDNPGLNNFIFTLSINLVISLVVSLWFVPAILKQLHQQGTITTRGFQKRIIVNHKRIYSRYIKHLYRYRWIVFLGCLLLFGIPTQFINSDKAKKLSKFIGGTINLFINSYQNYEIKGQKKDLELNVFFNTPEGSSIEKVNNVSKKFEHFLYQFKNDIFFRSSITSKRQGNIKILFKNKEENDFPFRLQALLENKAATIGGLNILISGLGDPYSKQYKGKYISEQIQLLGYNFNRLNHYANIFKTNLEKNARIENVYINSIAKHRELIQSFHFFEEKENNNLNYKLFENWIDKKAKKELFYTNFKGENNLIEIRNQEETNSFWELLNQDNFIDSFMFKGKYLVTSNH